MSLTKRIKGNYLIETVEYGDSITLYPAELDVDNAGEVVIQGNLTVLGETTTITSTETDIVDNTITLNSGEQGSGVTLGVSGIEIDRGTWDNTGIRFNESGGSPRWEATNDGTIWYSIDGSGLGALTAVVDDGDPHLGNNLIVAGYTITSEAAGDVVLDADTTGAVKVNHKLSLEHESTPTQYNEIYADAIGSGGTGLYTGAAEELVSKTKAITYSLIF